ncbi:MAG: hypothetical protein PHD81_03985 [Candidatus Nanoarchaeia archaeon]|nr:hypothetical protein [Candidatus Nanoarchaeia archaeon]MDD5588241.1 hypothetical protein [Candidatus Nanoarchaeia archaeon]
MIPPENKILTTLEKTIGDTLFQGLENEIDTNSFGEKDINCFSSTFSKYKSFLGDSEDKSLYKAYIKAALFDDYTKLYSLFLFSNNDIFKSSPQDYYKKFKKIIPLIISEEICKAFRNKDAIKDADGEEGFETFMQYSKKDLKEGVTQAFLANNIGPIIKVLPENNFFQTYRDLRKQNKIDDVKFEELLYYQPDLNKLISEL